MFRANLAGYLKLDAFQKSKIIFVNFDDFVVNPDPYLVNLEEFIGAKFGRSRKRILKRENCPRDITKKERDDKINEISNNLSASYRMKFQMLVNDYDSNPWKRL
jgi:hypothetical protein